MLKPVSHSGGFCLSVTDHFIVHIPILLPADVLLDKPMSHLLAGRSFLRAENKNLLFSGQYCIFQAKASAVQL